MIRLDSYTPLQGIQVLDLGDIRSGYCTKVMAAQGAEIIKVEPIEGESTRKLPPFAQDEAHPEKSLWFAHYNTDKKSITLDISKKRGVEVFKKLAEKADVVVETHMPGRMKSLGLDYSNLKKINSSLTLVSITPFGQTGPRMHDEDTELTAFANGGIHQMSGLSDQPPCAAPGFMAYDLAGIYAAGGTAVALMETLFSGEGQHLDISVQEANAACTNAQVPRYSHEGKFQGRSGFGFQPLGLIKVKDGYIAVLAFREQVIHLAHWMGSDILDNPMWKDTPVFAENADLLRPEIEKWYGQFDIDTAYKESQANHVPSMPAYTLSQFTEDDQVKFRKLFKEFDHPFLGKHQNLREPYVVRGTKPTSQNAAPLLGQHNQEIYSDSLKLPSAEIDDLRLSRVIA